MEAITAKMNAPSSFDSLLITVFHVSSVENLRRSKAAHESNVA